MIWFLEQVHSSALLEEVTALNTWKNRWLYCVHPLILFNYCLTSCFVIWIQWVQEAGGQSHPERCIFLHKDRQFFFLVFFLKDEDKLSEIEDAKRRPAPSQPGCNMMPRVWYAASCMTHLIKNHIWALPILESGWACEKKKKKKDLISQITWHHLTYRCIKFQPVKPSHINPKAQRALEANISCITALPVEQGKAKTLS